MPWKVSRIGHRRDTLTTLVESIGIALTSIYTVTPLLLFPLFFFLRLEGPLLPPPLLPPLFPQSGSLYSSSSSSSPVCYPRLLNFFRSFFWTAPLSLPRSIIAPSRDLIDDRFDYLRPAQSISSHIWVGSSAVSRFVSSPTTWDLIFPFSIRSILTDRWITTRWTGVGSIRENGRVLFRLLDYWINTKGQG